MSSAPPPPVPPSTAPTLSDGVVTLRAHRPEDAQGSYEQCQDPESQRWTSVPLPYTLEMAQAFVSGLMPQLWIEGSEWAFAVEHEGRYGGTISLRDEGHGIAEIAYGSHPRVRGTGVMERACRLLLEWGFAERGLRTVVWRAHQGNWASRRLAWRLGFSVEGATRQWLAQRGELRDAWLGTLLRDDPREPRTPWLDCPVLDGDGVRLRPLVEADLPRVVEGSADVESQHWLAQLPTPYTLQDARDYLEAGHAGRAAATSVTWAVVDPADERTLVATVGLYRIVAGREAEVGYWTHPDARGRGVARRAAAVATSYAFDALGLDRVLACASAGNTASRHVIESLGLTQVGVHRRAARTGDGAAQDLVFYDVLVEEWRAPER